MRLIDADKINPMRCPQSIEEMREWIDSQPTAYDVEAVVRELEEKADYLTTEIDSMFVELKFIELNEAIEIVRGGRNE
jgi:hypothetical protein